MKADRRALQQIDNVRFGQITILDTENRRGIPAVARQHQEDFMDTPLTAGEWLAVVGIMLVVLGFVVFFGGLALGI